MNSTEQNTFPQGRRYNKQKGGAIAISLSHTHTHTCSCAHETRKMENQCDSSSGLRVGGGDTRVTSKGLSLFHCVFVLSPPKPSANRRLTVAFAQLDLYTASVSLSAQFWKPLPPVSSKALPYADTQCQACCYITRHQDCAYFFTYIEQVFPAIQ